MNKTDPSITDYLTILGSTDVDEETKELARVALKASLKAIPDLITKLNSLIDSAK